MYSLAGKTVFVAGHRGLVGSALVRRLKGEDCAILTATRAELERLFGPAVADLVAEVTDDKSLPKAERKRRQVETAPRKSAGARAIKIADKTSNLRSLAASPPEGWERQRIADYVAWAEEVVAGCRGTNAALESLFDRAAAEVRGTL